MGGEVFAYGGFETGKGLVVMSGEEWLFHT